MLEHVDDEQQLTVVDAANFSRIDIASERHYCQFNRGVWQILVTFVRHWGKDRKTLYVITGSILDRDGNGNRDDDSAAKRMKSNNGKQRVAVPSHFYKIIASKRTDSSLDVLTIFKPPVLDETVRLRGRGSG